LKHKFFLSGWKCFKFPLYYRDCCRSFFASLYSVYILPLPEKKSNKTEYYSFSSGQNPGMIEENIGGTSEPAHGNMGGAHRM